MQARINELTDERDRLISQSARSNDYGELHMQYMNIKNQFERLSLTVNEKNRAIEQKEKEAIQWREKYVELENSLESRLRLTIVKENFTLFYLDVLGSKIKRDISANSARKNIPY